MVMGVEGAKWFVTRGLEDAQVWSGVLVGSVAWSGTKVRESWRSGVQTVGCVTTSGCLTLILLCFIVCQAKHQEMVNIVVDACAVGNLEVVVALASRMGVEILTQAENYIKQEEATWRSIESISNSRQKRFVGECATLAKAT